MPFSAWGNSQPCAQACLFPYAFLCLILPCGAGCSVGMPGTALPLRRSPRLTVVFFSDLPGAWASAARPSWYGWPATEPADGKNGGFGGREPLNPRILESSNPRIRAQYAGGHSCFLSGSGLDAGLLVSCPRIAAAGKTNYA